MFFKHTEKIKKKSQIISMVHSTNTNELLFLNHSKKTDRKSKSLKSRVLLGWYKTN